MFQWLINLFRNLFPKKKYRERSDTLSELNFSFEENTVKLLQIHDFQDEMLINNSENSESSEDYKGILEPHL